MAYLALLATCLFITAKNQVAPVYSTTKSSYIATTSATLLENPPGYRDYSTINQSSI